jgi:hypothetical protein
LLASAASQIFYDRETCLDRFFVSFDGTLCSMIVIADPPLGVCRFAGSGQGRRRFLNCPGAGTITFSPGCPLSRPTPRPVCVLSQLAVASPVDYGSWVEHFCSTMSGKTLRHDVIGSIRPERRRLRLATLAIIAAEVMFWLYTIYFIKRHTELNGTGLEVIAMIPMTAIALFLTLPALSLSFVKRALWLAFGLAILAGVADIAIWGRMVGEIGRAAAGGP